MPQVVKRCLVSGRVQGVFFRASTARKARSLGLDGSAVNLADGRVEVVVCGPPEQVSALCEWLWTGSPASRVSEVRIEDWDNQPDVGFTTR